MISRTVLDAFRRLAESAAATAVEADPRERAALDIAARAAAEAAGGGTPSGEQAGRLLDALADLDPKIRAMRESSNADPDIREKLVEALVGVIGDIARGVGRASDAVASSDAKRLVDNCRARLSKAVSGEGRETKSRGFNERLRGFADRLSRGVDKALADDVAAFVREAFSGELPGLANEYLHSQPYAKGKGSPSRGSLLAQQGGPAAARRQAESQVLAMLYESVIRRAERVRAGTYDEGFDDLASFNKAKAGVSEDIKHDKVDDQFKQPRTGLETPQAKWRLYVEPLRGTDMFAAGHADLGAILDWVNANFHREDLKSQAPVRGALPGGGSVTAPSFKRELTADDLNRWYAASRGESSIDVPISDGDGGTVGDAIGRRDQAAEDREEYKTDYLSDPANNARIRRRLEAVIHQAAASATVDSAKLRGVYEMVLLIKLGFASKPAARKKFEKAWREGGADIVGEDGNTIVQGKDVPHIPFRTELIDEELWRELGRPKRKGWEQDEDQSPHRRYRFPWKQKVLVRKDAVEPSKDVRKLRDDPDPRHWKIIEVEHTAAEEPEAKHFVNWVRYGKRDRDADIKKTLDAYDGDEWFRMSLQPRAQEALLKSLGEGHPLKKFKPEDVFTSYAVHVDAPMWRALGRIKLSVTPQPNELYGGLSGPAFDMKSVMQELTTILQRMEDDGDPDAPWILAYMAQKRVGKVSRLLRRTRAASAVDVESMVLSVVDDILPL
jgi:hypothetical protein